MQQDRELTKSSVRFVTTVTAFIADVAEHESIRDEDEHGMPEMSR